MRKAKTFSHARCLQAGLGAALLSLLCACGSGDNPVTGHKFSTLKAKHKAATSNPGEEPLTEMVAAVSATKNGPPVELRFALPQRPEVGQELDLSVAVVPLAPAPSSISVAFQVGDGLDIVDGFQLDEVEKPAEGAPLRHVVRIIPKRDGIFMVTAVVTLGPANQHVTRTFSIPVIAGEGMPEQVAKGS
jgi:hypothetical protein